MRRKTAGILLSAIIFTVFLTGCGKNKATEAANESVETEKEGNGEDAETEKAEKEKSEKEKAEKEEAEKTEAANKDVEIPKEETVDSEKTEATEAIVEEEPAETVGVLFPSDEKWSLDCSELKSLLEEKGYEAEIFFAEDADKQSSQIRELLKDENLSALILTPVDEYSLAEVLEETKELSISVFDYDKLIMDTDGLKYYITFDTRKIGQKIAEELIKRQELDKAAEEKKSYTIEFLMGEPDDNASLFLFNGIMEGLQAYFDDGTLVCRSERTTFDDTAVMRLNADTAKGKLEEIIEQYYAEEGTPDIICTASDGFALAAMEILEDAGITPGEENWPVITGLGARAECVKAVAEEKMDFTVFMDGRSLAEKCAEVVDTYLKGKDVEVEDYKQYDNGVKLIGACTCEGRIIDKDNYQILVDNGYYEAQEIAPETEPAKPDITAAPQPTAAPEEKNV